MRLILTTVFLVSLVVPWATLLPVKYEAGTCGYDTCPTGNPDMLNVHLLCHTHDDVGWQKTVDDYYYGDHNSIRVAGVQYVLDTVIDELLKSPDRKFIYVESSFFWRWWTSRDDTVHQQVQQLVQSGQLEFIGGGWCMNDEASVYYVDTIDQMTWGFRFLNDTFGSCGIPRVAWQIDPFGHSRETASLFAQMGYDGLFFARADFQDKIKRGADKTMELIWKGSPNLGDDADLFTGMFPELYGPPAGFCFDILCSDEPIKDNPNLKDYNIDKRVNEFIAESKSKANIYATNHIAFTMGGDFQYQSARNWYVNLDKLIQYVNAKQAEGSQVNVFYSTPSCYLNALNSAQVNWTTKTDDFFPYASDEHSYWTGYFTSRPAFKGYTKVTNNILQIGKQLSTFANLLTTEHLDPLRRAQGDAQHHDAIAGTAKQHVNNDYTESLSNGVSHAQMAINMAYDSLLPVSTTLPPRQEFCPYLNVSYCPETENQNAFVVTAYNALSRPVRSLVRVPVTSTSYTVTGPDGTAVESQVVPIPQAVLDDPEKQGTAQNDLVFSVDLPPVGFSSYFVETSPGAPYSEKLQRQTRQAADLVIQNEHLSVACDGTTGLLKTVTDLTTQKTYNVAQNFYYYVGTKGFNLIPSDRASGAYIFRPDGNETTPVGQTVTATLINEYEIQQTFSDYVSQVIRLYPGETDVELEWLVGPIPIGDGLGKEIITRYDTDLATDGYFYTDANGREMLERRRDYRPTWNVRLAEPVAGNYYPINSKIYIKDEAQDSQVTIITDRSQGGGSLRDGSIEIMVHRRLLYDDDKGVGEPLNEPGVDGLGLRVRGKHRLQVNSIANAAVAHRLAGSAISYPPYVSIAPLTTTADEWRQTFVTSFSGLAAPLPDNVNLVTLEPWRDGSVLLRLEHYFELTDDPSGLSQSVSVNLQTLFSGFQIVEATETTLGANKLLVDKRRLVWNTDSGPQTFKDVQKGGVGDALNITLSSMEIRTFIVKPAFN